MEASGVPETKQKEYRGPLPMSPRCTTTACEGMAHVGTISCRRMVNEMESSQAPAVRVQNVVKRVRDGSNRRLVLDDVSFDVRCGELVVVQGPSGSGKTTLLAIVGAMLSPTSGEVHLDG